jgi:hypothetical protein
MSEGANWRPATWQLWWAVAAVALVLGAIVPALWLKAYCLGEAAGSQRPVAYHVTVHSESAEQRGAQPTEPPNSIFPMPTPTLGLPGKTTTSETTDYSAPEPDAFWHRFLCEINGADYTLAVFTVLLAIFTVALWYVTWRTLVHAQESAAQQAKDMKVSLDQSATLAQANLDQARASNDAVSQSERHARQELRAYVGVTGVRWETHWTTFRVVVTFKNHGKTPAYRLRISAAAEFAKEKTVFEEGQFIGAEVTIQPGEEQPMGVVVLNLPDHKASWGSFVNFKAGLFVWGEARYLDTFNEERITYFRLINRGGANKTQFSKCDAGNDTT